MSVFLNNQCPDEPDLEGRTAFMWAAGKGADDVIKVFLCHGVDIHQEDKTGDTGNYIWAVTRIAVHGRCKSVTFFNSVFLFFQP